MPKNLTKKIVTLCCSSILLSLCTTSNASDFNVPFINVSQLGSTYSGWAAEANDASIEYSNPAGMVMIPNQQLSASLMGVTGVSRFTGITNPPYFPLPALMGSASTSLNAFMPSIYYVAPINEDIFFGVGVTTPFALASNFATDSILRYDATRTQIVVNDIGPSMAVKITDKLSAGIGLDIDRISMTFDNIVGFPPVLPDYTGINHMTGWGYGVRGGLLYQFTPETRMGVNYDSQVAFHATGYSDLFNSTLLPGGEVRTTSQNASIRMPPLAQLSLYHDLNCQWSVMGTAFYSDWSVLQQTVLQNVVIPPAGATTPITIPFVYHDTVDYSAGINYKLCPQWTFRTGAEFLQAAPSERYRVAADPVGAGIVVGVGAHYQQNHYLGYDIGYGHAFFEQTPINETSSLGDSEMGHVNTYTNVFGAQLTWNFT